MPDRINWTQQPPPNVTLGGIGGAAGAATPTGAPAPTGAKYNPADPSFRTLTPGVVQKGRQVYAVGPDGSLTQIHDLDLGSQVANNTQLGAQFNAQAPGYASDFNTTFNKQMGLADMLNNTIQNANAPSVAAQQEAESLQSNDATQLAAAAGGSGQNAFLARRQAANNMAGLGAADAQTGALRRAQEVASAQSNLGGLLQGAGAGAAGMFGATTGLGLNYNQLSGNEEMGGNANVTNQRGQNIGLIKDATTGAGSGGASAAASGGGGGGGLGDLSLPAGAGADDIALASDERIKDDIHPEDDRDEETFARALQPRSFKYKGQGKQRHGVMAQDVERGGPIGRSLVEEGDGGVKGLDVAQGLGAALSLLGYLHKKIEKLESDRG